MAPDNATAPPWLSVKCEATESRLVCRVSVDCEEPRRVLSLRNTIDDLIVSLKSALDSLRELADLSDKA
ncbi:MAG: KEOPS complex subunit Pcc1 [Acidilobaceae archaeon]